MKYKVMIILNYLMVVLFLFAVVVQYNDPDAARWMAIYGAAAVASYLYASGRYRRIIPVLVLVAALIWAGTIFPTFFEGERFSFSTFNSVRMTNMEYETAREFGGLMIVAVWMGVIALLPPSSRE